jgi:DNA-binding response OmpR family regulator
MRIATRRKLLIVDNDRSLHPIYREAFEADGFDVSIATNGWDAVKSVRRHRPSLVVLDSRLPGMDGVETMSRLISMDRELLVILRNPADRATEKSTANPMKPIGDYTQNLRALRRSVHSALR